MNNNIIKIAFIRSLPIMAGYLVLGMGFGVILLSKGYGVFWSFLMGTLIYAGSLQYLGVNLISSGANLITIALTSLMVNARHLFYGISMIDKYKNVGKKKLYLMFSLTDETYSLVCNDTNNFNKQDRVNYYFYISLFNHIYWILGCVLGSLIGNIISFNTEGLDFALTALFVVVFIEQWLTTKNHTYSIVGVVVSIICLIFFGKNNFLIPSMIFIIIIITILKYNKER